MELEITPEPSDEERAAIEAALAQEARDQAEKAVPPPLEEPEDQ